MPQVPDNPDVGACVLAPYFSYRSVLNPPFGRVIDSMSLAKLFLLVELFLKPLGCHAGTSQQRALLPQDNYLACF
jgi:hypothetical protein